MRRTRITELAETGHRRAKAIDRLRQNPDRFFATVQIGITLVSATAAALGGADLAGQVEPVFRRWGLGNASGTLAFVVVVGGISYLSLVLGELVPKSLGIRFSEGYSLFIGPPLLRLSRVTKPLVWLLTGSSNLLLRFFGDRTTFSEGRMSAEELQQLVADAAKQGSVDTDTGEIASRAFDLEAVSVSGVMTPRGRMICIEREATFDELKAMVLDAGHARLPVKHGSVDNIVGYLLDRDLLALAWEGRPFDIDGVMRPAYFVPETMRALDALREMQRRRAQLAIVVDERGTVAGLVTVEDLVEELVGDIVSEEELPPEIAQPQPDGTWVVQGGASVRDVMRAVGFGLPEGDGYDTIAGLCIEQAGRIPERGDRFELDDGVVLDILDASPRRVRTVRIHPPPAPEQKEEAPAADAEPESHPS